jgi:hypothetical protein
MFLAGSCLGRTNGERPNQAHYPGQSRCISGASFGRTNGAPRATAFTLTGRFATVCFARNSARIAIEDESQGGAISWLL